MGGGLTGLTGRRPRWGNQAQLATVRNKGKSHNILAKCDIGFFAEALEVSLTDSNTTKHTPSDAPCPANLSNNTEHVPIIFCIRFATCTKTYI